MTFLCPSVLAAPLIIDDFDYADDAAAQAAWVEKAGSLPVEMGTSGAWGNERVMLLPCNFIVQENRSIWDRSVLLDLSGYREFALEAFVPDPGAISQFTLYFHSVDGWYAQSVNVTRPGWQTLYFSVIDFVTEGTPAGWDAVDSVRLSPWKEADADSYLAARELRAYTPQVFIVKDTDTQDSRTVDRASDLLAEWLGRYNISLGIIDDVAVEAGYLAGSRMAILPFNDALPDAQLTELENYVAAGGKLMVFYVLDDRVADLLGIQRTGWTQGDFAAYTFSDAVIQDLPGRVLQKSWNITIAAPGAQYNARTIAGWEDPLGNPTGHPAWLASDNGLFMSHIILADDAETKQYMLLILIGHYLPEIWPVAAAAAIENIGRIANYLAYDQAVADIQSRGAATPRSSEVQAELALADASRNQALAEHSAGQYSQAVLSVKQARSHLQEAYYLCQTAVWPEFRAVWQHSGTGPYPGDWAAAIDSLADNHFTAVFPNMLWGGLAHYNSQLLPLSDAYLTHGDQILACVDAAHSRGIEVHVWKVNWNLSTAPQSFIDSMRQQQRTQVTRDGNPVDWLCPSHPDNFQLERDSMLEVVQNYDVDGIHFDYIRYPDREHCYCDGCRTRFEQQTGNTVNNWPDDVVDGGPLESEFLDWRRAQITKLVEAVYQGVQATRPEVQVSAAVFSNYSYAYDGVGQDWVKWINDGIVDFLCPMDYTNDFDHFEDLVTEQLDHAAGRIPIYPGIGASASLSSFGPDGVIVQILATRALGTGGFILFNFGRELTEEDLPALGKGTTAPAGSDGGVDGGGEHDAEHGVDEDDRPVESGCSCGGSLPRAGCFLILLALVAINRITPRVSL